MKSIALSSLVVLGLVLGAYVLRMSGCTLLEFVECGFATEYTKDGRCSVRLLLYVFRLKRAGVRC